MQHTEESFYAQTLTDTYVIRTFSSNYSLVLVVGKNHIIIQS